MSRPKACAAIRGTPAQRRLLFCASAPARQQLGRYLDLMRRDTLLGTVHGILAAQLIKPQARMLATDRGISCVTVDYGLLRGLESTDDRLF
jgi:RecB family endonuclease NucS